MICRLWIQALDMGCVTHLFIRDKGMKLKKCIIYTVSAEKVVVISLMEGDNKDALPKKATHFGQLQV